MLDAFNIISLVATPEQFMIKGGSHDHVGRYIYNTDLSHIGRRGGGVVWNGVRRLERQKPCSFGLACFGMHRCEPD